MKNPPPLGLPFVFDENCNFLKDIDEIFDALDSDDKIDPSGDIEFDRELLESEWVQEQEEDGQVVWYLKKGAPAKIVLRYKKFIERLYRDDDGGIPNSESLIDRLMNNRV